MPAIFNSTELLDQLQYKVSRLLTQVAEELAHLPGPVLQLPPDQHKWSAIQCLEHLNIYSRYYLPQLAKAIQTAQLHQQAATPQFKSGWLGNWFTGIMQPKPDGSLPMRMPSPKNAQPAATPDVTSVMNEFINGQQQLLLLLQQAHGVNLAQPRIPTTLSKLIKFSLGDTFRFFIAHEERHVLQALRAVGPC